MRIVIAIAALVLMLPAFKVVAEAASQPADTDARIAAATEQLYRAVKEHPEGLYFQNDLYRISGFGDASARQLVALYSDPALAKYQKEFIPVLAINNSEKIRGIMLDYEKTHSLALPEYTFTFFSEHLGEYSAEQKKEIHLMTTNALESQFTAYTLKAEVVARLVDNLGRFSSKEDAPLIEKTAKLKDNRWNILARFRQRALARLGNAEAKAAVIADLNDKSGEQVEKAIQDIVYIGSPDLARDLIRFIDDKRIGIKFFIGYGSGDRTTGNALDVVAAEAIFELAKPSWPLTAPDSKVVGKGIHEESGTTKIQMTHSVKKFTTLSPEQTAEVKAWAAKQFPDK